MNLQPSSTSFSLLIIHVLTQLVVICISSKDLSIVILLRVIGGAGGLRGSLRSVLGRWFNLVYEVGGRRVFVGLFLKGAKEENGGWLVKVVV